jgi:hypothetical protein
MTTTPDPKLVQELGTELMLDAAREIDYMGIGERYFDDERCAHLDDDQKEALQDAISDFVSEATVTVAGPAEQPNAEQDGDEAAGRVTAFLGDWPNGDVVWFATAEDVPALTVTDLRAVLADRKRLAARVAELEAEQPQDDGDVRAVAALAAADDDEQLDRAVSELIARFADRIEALEARDTDPADATGTALSATETDDDGSRVSVDAANSSANAAGLSGRCPCGCPKIGDGCNCHFCNEPYPTQQPEDAKTTCGFPACGHPDHQRNDETGTER